MDRTCRKCGSNDLYENNTNNLCKTCSRQAAKARYYKLKAENKRRVYDYCSSCYVEKAANLCPVCSKCNQYKQEKVRFFDKSDNFKIDLYQFVKQIEQRNYNLYELDLLKIINYWCEITVQPHRYWTKTQSQQIRFMFDDLKLFLEGKAIKKNKKIYG